jgi:hypothetical protein
MVCYSADFLSKCAEVPEFSKIELAVKYTQEHSTCHSCQYPILTLGEYKISEDPGSKVIQVALDAITVVGAGIFFAYTTPSSLFGIGASLLMLFVSETGKKVTEVAIGYALCPAAVEGRRAKYNDAILGQMLVRRQKAHALLVDDEDDRHQVTRLKLTRGETSYDAYFVTRGQNISSKWVIHALDGHESADFPMVDLDVHYLLHQLYPNHCYITGPSVGLSTGWPTKHQIGAGYEAGLRLLESIGATHIVMEAKGVFAGATLAEAVNQHEFAKNVNYMSVAIGTAGNIKEYVRDRFTIFGAGVVSYAQMDFDLEKASQKLSEHRIEQIVVQHRDEKNPVDGVLSDGVTLAAKLEKRGLTDYQTVLVHPDFHNSTRRFEAPYQEIKKPMMDKISKFFED